MVIWGFDFECGSAS